MPRFKGTLKINHDFLGGILLVAVAAGAYLLGQGYAVGSVSRMGPGYLPTALSLILGVIGTAIAIAGQFKPSEAPEIRILPLLLVAAALIVFALMLRRTGLFPAALVTVLIASLADHDITWRGRIVLALATASFASLVFIVGLGMPVRLWWG